MADDEDDYLSDKFLVESTPSRSTKTYSDIRKEATKQSQLKNERNRIKSRREREAESREEGLNKSLFERANEEAAAGLNSGNKALSIMMKMGFKPGQSLGQAEEVAEPASDGTTLPQIVSEKEMETSSGESSKPKDSIQHRKEPIGINEWAGKKGIGLGSKRSRSPGVAERVAKMAKMAENAEHTDFRQRARRDYEERRAEGKLGPAQRTCATLDEKAGKEFHVLWLNPENPLTFPEGLIEALTVHASYTLPSSIRDRDNHTIEGRLRKQMQNDALQSLDNDDGSDTLAKKAVIEDWDPETLEEAASFLRLQAQDRLTLVLSYLRSRYNYCLWCGTQYDNKEDLDTHCPGQDEDDHD